MSIIDFGSRRKEILGSCAIKKAPDYRGTLEKLGRGAIDDAIKDFRKIAEEHPGDPSVFYNLGFALGERGLLAEACEAYTQALAIDRSFHNARYNLALELIAMGQAAEAERQLKVLLELAPNDADAHFELGRLHESRGALDFALHEYDKVSRIKPSYRLIHFCRANVLFRLKRYGEALKACNQELDANPGFEDAKVMMEGVKAALALMEKKGSLS
ncbi:MAG: tetratricopeptide repeat protein [Planctomycetota bacterium]